MLVERSFDTGKVVLNIAEGAKNGPPLLLLHGATMEWQSFSELLPTLEQDWHVYALDFRGHGKSGWVPEAYRLDDFVQDTSAVIEHLIGQPVVVMGFSLGATISLGVAAQLPHLVRAIVPLDPGLIFRDYESLISMPGPHQWVYEFIQWVTKNVRMAGSLEALKAANPEFDDSTAREQAAWLQCLDPTMVTTFLPDHGQYDFEQVMRLIDCPALLIRGDPALGGVVRDGDLELFQKLVRRNGSVQISGVGHGIIWGEPGIEILRHVKEFSSILE